MQRTNQQTQGLLSDGRSKINRLVNPLLSSALALGAGAILALATSNSMAQPGTVQIDFNASKTGLLFTWTPASDGLCSVLGSDDLSKPLSNWTEVTNVATQNGLMRAEIPLPATKTFFRIKINLLPPEAPSTLEATALSLNSINLAWPTATNATGYKIEQRTGVSGTFNPVATAGGSATTFTVTGLTANTYYSFQIRATNAAGVSVASPQASAMTLAWPVGLNGDYFNNQTLNGPPVLTRTDAGINFDWGTNKPNASLPADGFSVRWSGRVMAQYTENYTFYTSTDDGVRLWVNGDLIINDWKPHAVKENSGSIALTAGRYYEITMEYYEVSGPASAKLSWASPSITKALIPQSRLYLPAPPAPPAAPSGLSAVSTTNQITLTWIDNANNETNFEIERKIGAAGVYAKIETVDVNTRSYPNKGLLADTQFYYRIRAVNAVGSSDYSAAVTATTPSPSPLKPAILSQGYDNILNLQITGTPGNWLLSDVSTRQLQSGYEWWYLVGSKVIKRSSNLTNEPWNGNHPGRVMKLGGKIGLDTFNRWSNESGTYHDPAAGMYFERGDVAGVTTFLFR